MINANELRRGNRIIDCNFPNLFASVTGISEEGCIHTNYSEDLYTDQIEPILLTPELLGNILTKVSDKEFKIEIPVDWSKTHHTGYWFIVKWFEYIATGDYHVGWRPYLQKPKAYPQLTEEPPLEELFLWGYLESLHQLQNYYHSVAMAELPITNL